MRTPIYSKKIKAEAKAIGKTINALLDKHKAAVWKSGFPCNETITAEEQIEIYETSKVIASLEDAALIIKRIR